MANEWGIPVGWTGTRKEIAAMYGGTRFGGMETPSTSPNVLLFSDPKVGRENGYEFDGWSADGEVFSYTGMDRVGPQKMHKGNLALRDHKLNGKAVRLFGVSGKAAVGNGQDRIYLGEFAIDDDYPYSTEDAPGVDGVLRTVFVFHLRPVGEILRREEDLSSKAAAPTDSGSASQVPLENHAVEEFERAGTEAGTGKKREQDLVNVFQTILESRGHKLDRFKVYPKGSTMPLFTDIHDATEGILYEAKADATRNSVRAGLGQLLDYRRYVDGRPCRLLLPAAPNGDLLELLAEHDIAAVWRVGDTSSFQLHESGSTRAF
ncbi:hypothetical protein [Arthrobacter burdickii]|uniref:ScoMcrA-like SRA domain-containing protein n=1 Tax=Arthrobacter burdickii TaxID=3035920 RepID=A0ABT8K548_9MICC|nr:hypothetical protein [Arthrobacter burdickii]MDN4611926.1 hypothetical protein [Arthrobacter burdickii]